MITRLSGSRVVRNRRDDRCLFGQSSFGGVHFQAQRPAKAPVQHTPKKFVALFPLTQINNNIKKKKKKTGETRGKKSSPSTGAAV